MKDSTSYLIWRWGKRILLHVVVIFLAWIYLLPLLFTLSTSFKTPAQIFELEMKWIPQPFRWQNYVEALTALPFALFFKNTVVVTLFCLIGEVTMSAVVGYGFARIRFRGREILFFVMLGTMMVPHQARMIPTFIIFKNLGWLDTYLPLIVPAYFGANPFYIFLFRQFFRGIPYEFDEAAQIDGANNFTIFSRIIVPLSRPVVASVVIFSFMYRWNEFWAPLIYIRSQEKFTMALALSYFKGEYATEYHLITAVTVVMLLPCIILFFSAQKHFVKGVTTTGLKG